jgi:hypothetical protein
MTCSHIVSDCQLQDVKMLPLVNLIRDCQIIHSTELSSSAAAHPHSSQSGVRDNLIYAG